MAARPRFHPWPIAIAQATVEVAGEGIVLGAYAGHVIAADVANICFISSVNLIAQHADIGDVLRILVLVIS
ncbi:hypothetical protein Xmer_16735 [Xanthomonas campestris pv. merremiae]|nr:hypothetical protein [Xanthomonas campestris pv. merremiae]